MTKTTIKKLQILSDALDKTDKKTLSVGFFNSKIASYAAKQEYGALEPVSDEYRARGLAKGIELPDVIPIPSRPFMRDAYNKNHTKWVKLFNRTFIKTKNIDASLRVVGDEVKTNIEYNIINANSLYSHNYWKTIAIKEKDTVLRDSGNMLKSVEYDIK